GAGSFAAFARRPAALLGLVPAAPVEVGAPRARAERVGTRLPEAAPPDAAGGPVRRRAPLGGSWEVLPGAAVARGARLEGPVLVEEATTVVHVPAGWTAERTPFAWRLGRS